MMDFTRYVATRLGRLRTPQSAPIPGTAQVPNSAGGFAWAVDGWTRLDRFLVLGSEGGTYYVGERELTLENAAAAADCLVEDGPRTVRRVVEVSTSGRAPRNDPALFVLAMAAGLGDPATRRAALDALPRVARTGTHLFHWLRYVQAFRGWGRGRAAGGGGLVHRPARPGAGLPAPQVPVPRRVVAPGRAAAGAPPAGHGGAGPPVPPHGVAADRRRSRRAGGRSRDGPAAAGRGGAARGGRRPRPRRGAGRASTGSPARCSPPSCCGQAVVWEALLEEMPLTALVRNLGVMSGVGLLAPMSEAAKTVAARLTDREALRRARVHPRGGAGGAEDLRAGPGDAGEGPLDPRPAGGGRAGRGLLPGLRGRGALAQADAAGAGRVRVDGRPDPGARST